MAKGVAVGRPRIYEETMVRKIAHLTPAQIAYVEQMGRGDFAKGLRSVIDAHRGEMDEPARPEERETLTLVEAADRLGMHRTTVRYHLVSGNLKGERTEKGWEIDPQSLTTFAESRKGA